MLNSGTYSRKKKGRFTLIPIPGSDTQPTAASPAAPAISADSIIKRAPEPRSKPAGLTIIPETTAIKQQSRPVVEDEPPASAGEATNENEAAKHGPREPVTQDDLIKAWTAYADEAIPDDKRSLYATLMGSNPQLDGNTIRFSLVNSIQEKDVTEIKADLLDYLRKRLNNVDLELNAVVEMQQAVKKEFLSDREKYNRMVEKNPLLEELRKKLNLDLG